MIPPRSIKPLSKATKAGVQCSSVSWTEGISPREYDPHPWMKPPVKPCMDNPNMPLHTAWTAPPWMIPWVKPSPPMDEATPTVKVQVTPPVVKPSRPKAWLPNMDEAPHGQALSMDGCGKPLVKRPKSYMCLSRCYIFKCQLNWRHQRGNKSICVRKQPPWMPPLIMRLQHGQTLPWMKAPPPQSSTPWMTTPVNPYLWHPKAHSIEGHRAAKVFISPERGTESLHLFQQHFLSCTGRTRWLSRSSPLSEKKKKLRLSEENEFRRKGLRSNGHRARWSGEGGSQQASAHNMSQPWIQWLRPYHEGSDFQTICPATHSAFSQSKTFDWPKLPHLTGVTCYLLQASFRQLASQSTPPQTTAIQRMTQVTSGISPLWHCKMLCPWPKLCGSVVSYRWVPVNPNKVNSWIIQVY